MPWPPRSAELRRVEWSEYLRNPGIGILVDPATGEPYGNAISVRARVLDSPPSTDLEDLPVGEIIDISLVDYLTAETRRIDLGRIPWSQLIEFRVINQPPALELETRKKALPKDFEMVKKFLFEILADGPVSELEVIGRAADSNISIAGLRDVKERLRIASVKDPTAEYPKTLWRLRMSQSYKLHRRKSADTKR